MVSHKPAYFHGSPGTAKSAGIVAAVKHIAENTDYFGGAPRLFWNFQDGPLPSDYDPENTAGLIECRGANMDPLDAKGAGTIDLEQNILRFVQNGDFPDEQRHCEYGFVFFDELSQSTDLTLKSLRNLLLDRCQGTTYRLPDGWHMVAAGNKPDDNSSVTKLPAYFANSFSHYEMLPDPTEFAHFLLTKYGVEETTVPEFIRFQEDLLVSYERGELSFGSYRTWEEAHKVVLTVEDPADRKLFASAHVGVSAWQQFEAYEKVKASIPTFRDIANDPLGTIVPEPGTSNAAAACTAICGMVLKNTTKDNLDAMFAYIRRFPEPFQIMYANDLKTIDVEMTGEPAFASWRADHPHSTI